MADLRRTAPLAFDLDALAVITVEDEVAADVFAARFFTALLLALLAARLEMET